MGNSAIRGHAPHVLNTTRGRQYPAAERYTVWPHAGPIASDEPPRLGSLRNAGVHPAAPLQPPGSAATAHRASRVRPLGVGPAAAVRRWGAQGVVTAQDLQSALHALRPRAAHPTVLARRTSHSSAHDPAEFARRPTHPCQQVRRNRSSTRTPNSRDSTGTRSSTPWNIPAKSNSGGSFNGAKP